MAYDKVVDSAALDAKLTAIADGFRISRETNKKFTLDEMAVLAAEKASSVPDGTGVTFGNVDGIPVEREESYAISSGDLNAIAGFVQEMAGKSMLMTTAEVIYWLDRVKYIPQGNANSALDTVGMFTSNAV